MLIGLLRIKRRFVCGTKLATQCRLSSKKARFAANIFLSTRAPAEKFRAGTQAHTHQKNNFRFIFKLLSQKATKFFKKFSKRKDFAKRNYAQINMQQYYIHNSNLHSHIKTQKKIRIAAKKNAYRRREKGGNQKRANATHCYRQNIRAISASEISFKVGSPSGDDAAALPPSSLVKSAVALCASHSKFAAPHLPTSVFAKFSSERAAFFRVLFSSRASSTKSRTKFSTSPYLSHNGAAVIR